MGIFKGLIGPKTTSDLTNRQHIKLVHDRRAKGKSMVRNPKLSKSERKLVSTPPQPKISGREQHRQDQAALTEPGKNPKGFSKMSPAAQARAILAQPTTGGPQVASSKGIKASLPKSGGKAGNFLTQPRDPRTGRWIRK